MAASSTSPAPAERALSLLDDMARASHQRLAEDRSASNERLEFLGDRVLGLVVAETLFARYPGEEEGELARRYAGLTSREGLVRVAANIDLDRYVRAQHGDREHLLR